MKKILRPKQASTYTALSLPTMWRLIKKGDFPAKIQLSSRAVGFYEEDIAEWLEKRKAV